MTSQKDIQSLIADIDSILHKTDARLPWSKPGDAAKERRVLERVRSYLVAQQQNFGSVPEQQPLPVNLASTEVAQQIAQVVAQEINLLRTDLLQPLQADVEALRNEREALVREIHQLEGARQQLVSLPQQKIVQQQVISEFSQELVNHCAESLTQQLAQLLMNFEEHWVNSSSTPGAITTTQVNKSKSGSLMQAQDRQEQLRQLQLQSDQMLITLDANQRTIFEALQRNLQSYQESLSQGLETMHTLGVQGEMLFTALVNRLGQQLERETSTLAVSPEQLSSSLAPTNQMASSHQTTPETLLPNALGGMQQGTYVANASDVGKVALTSQPNALFETPPLQPLSPVDSLLTHQSSEIISTEVSDVMGNVTAIPLTSSNVTQAIAQEFGVTTPEASVEDTSLENLDSEDWEIIEGLDFESLGVEPDDHDGLDSFLQLDIDPQQEQDTTAERNFSSDIRRQDIEQLYQSLFGTDSLTDTTQLGDSSISAPQSPEAFPIDNQSDITEPPHALTSFQMLRDDQISSVDLVNPLLSKVEDVLFEGLADPATQPAQTQPQEESVGQLGQSWEDLFFEDSIAQNSTETNWVGEAQASSLTASQPESIKTIAKLTELFEEMDLEYSAPVAEDKSMPVTTNQPTEGQYSETNSQSDLGEEHYIPASPDEDLLTTEGVLESTPGREISVEQRTLQQLQHDLYSFEESERQQLPRQPESRSLDHELESQSIVPDATPVNQQNQWFPMWEELLAEDWEEVMHNRSSVAQPDSLDSDTEKIATPIVENAIPANSTQAIPESVESDFEPELFPSETLELDHENAINSNTTASEELVKSGEPIALEDETLIEQWDEPEDGTPEERISSPELEFDSHSSSQSTVNTEQEDAVSSALLQELTTLEHEALNPMPPDNEAKSHQDSDSQANG